MTPMKTTDATAEAGPQRTREEWLKLVADVVRNRFGTPEVAAEILAALAAAGTLAGEWRPIRSAPCEWLRQVYQAALDARIAELKREG